MPKRNLTVGVTVNLKNYESLRLEVQDEVESEEDVRSLVAFLDETLALFGRGNPETEEIIAHYRRRVMEGAVGEGAVPATPATPAPAAAKPAPRPAVAPAVEPLAPEPVAAEPPEAAASTPAPTTAPKAAPKPAPKAPPKVPAPSPTGAVCEECSAPVSAAEEKTSRLFVSRILCKKCIQTL